MPARIAWLDLETEGSDEHRHAVLEVGVVITDFALEEVERYHALVRPDPDWMPARVADPVVAAMHRSSGLFDDVTAHGRDPAQVDVELARWLKTHAHQGQVALAGSGTSHFDSRFLRRHLPRTRKRLTYWSYDVGAVRRFLRDLAAWDPPGPAPADLPHRALPDAERALDEARGYRDLLRARPQLAPDLLPL